MSDGLGFFGSLLLADAALHHYHPRRRTVTRTVTVKRSNGRPVRTVTRTTSYGNRLNGFYFRF